MKRFRGFVRDKDGLVSSGTGEGSAGVPNQNYQKAGQMGYVDLTYSDSGTDDEGALEREARTGAKE